jgi:hypothetical protein
MNNYRRRPPRSTQDVGVYTEETKKDEGEGKPTTDKKLEWTGYGHALFGLSGFHGGHEAGQAGPQRLHSTIFPFGLKAEFLAHQNRRPPPSFARRCGPLVPRGCSPGPPDFL